MSHKVCYKDYSVTARRLPRKALLHAYCPSRYFRKKALKEEAQNNRQATGSSSEPPAGQRRGLSGPPYPRHPGPSPSSPASPPRLPGPWPEGFSCASCPACRRRTSAHKQGARRQRARPPRGSASGPRPRATAAGPPPRFVPAGTPPGVGEATALPPSPQRREEPAEATGRAPLSK